MQRIPLCVKKVKGTYLLVDVDVVCCFVVFVVVIV